MWITHRCSSYWLAIYGVEHLANKNAVLVQSFQSTSSRYIPPLFYNKLFTLDCVYILYIVDRSKREQISPKDLLVKFYVVAFIPGFREYSTSKQS